MSVFPSAVEVPFAHMEEEKRFLADEYRIVKIGLFLQDFDAKMR